MCVCVLVKEVAVHYDTPALYYFEYHICGTIIKLFSPLPRSANFYTEDHPLIHTFYLPDDIC